jgi:hypothetical protein
MEEDRRTSKEYAVWVFRESIGRLRKKKHGVPKHD